MNVRQLEAFRAIMSTGTTARAAEFMHTSQPAISRLLAQLESSLRMKLFEREKSRLRPTPEGKLLLVEVERAFTGLDHIRERAAWIRSGAGGSLTVATLPALGFAAMPRIVARFREAFPQMVVRLEIVGSNEVRDRVASGRCDIGFAADEIDTAGVAVEPLSERAGLLALPTGHVLCRHRQVSVEQISHHPFVALAARDTARRQLEEAVANKGLNLNVVAEAAYSLTIASLVKAGVGIGLVNPLALTELDQRGLELRSVRERIVFRTFAVSNAATAMSAPIARFVAAARQVVAEV